MEVEFCHDMTKLILVVTLLQWQRESVQPVMWNFEWFDGVVVDLLFPKPGVWEGWFETTPCILFVWSLCISWCKPLVYRIGLLYWFVVLVCCIGLLYWFVVLVCCIGLLYWFVVLVCYKQVTMNASMSTIFSDPAKLHLLWKVDTE